MGDPNKDKLVVTAEKKIRWGQVTHLNGLKKQDEH